jgi:apolipoprotein N-acyltransferase
MRNSVALAVLCGILYVFSFAPWDLPHLQWFLFLPLFFAVDLMPSRIRNRSWMPLFLLGMVPSAIITLGGFYWVVHATQQYGGLPLGASIGVWLVFSLVNQLQIPLYLIFRRYLHETPWPGTSEGLRALGSAGILGLSYAGIESLYPKLFLDTAGHAFYHAPWVRQWADLGGPFVITSLILILNELLYVALKTRRKPAGVAIALLALLIPSYGVLRARQFEPSSATLPGETFRVSMIQANIGDYLKLAAERGGFEATEEVMDRYLRLSLTAAQASDPPDAILWPETAYPAIFGEPKSQLEYRMDQRLRNHLRESASSHIIGGYDADERRQEYNSLFFFQPGGSTPSVYHKSILLLFGETLPLADVFPTMKSWFPTMGFFGRGPGPRVFEVVNRRGSVFRLAPSICYEGLFSDYSAEGALLGADALLNVTNDSWFGPHGEPYLHLALTQFRAIETRLPLVRSTNTGISVIISPSGETTASSGIGTEEVISGVITQRKHGLSPYLKMASVFGGNWFPRACQLLTLLTWMIARFKRSRQS